MPSAGAASSDADVAVVKSSTGREKLEVGGSFSYSITVTNRGGAEAHGVVVNDDLPPGIRVDTVLPQLTGGSCAVASSTSAGGVERWSVHCSLASLPAGASVGVTFDVTVLAGTRCGELQNVATVAAANEPSVNVGPENRAATADEIACSSSIKIDVSPRPDSGTPGDVIVYSYVVVNTGDGALIDITVDDDRLGHIGDIARLAAGDSRMLTRAYTLSARVDWVVNTGTATGTDSAGDQVSDSDAAAITIVAIGGGDGGGPTAFTGVPPIPSLAAVALGALGCGALLLARRRA
jgi:uncharacterized repeat protein (TIGR01451 family)